LSVVRGEECDRDRREPRADKRGHLLEVSVKRDGILGVPRNLEAERQRQHLCGGVLAADGELEAFLGGRDRRREVARHQRKRGAQSREVPPSDEPAQPIDEMGQGSLITGYLIHPPELEVVLDAPEMSPEGHVGAIGTAASELAGSFRDGEALDDVIRAGERVMPGVQGQQQGIRILGRFG
jgi:hypothetical protein